jgi:hypothetical protein
VSKGSSEKRKEGFKKIRQHASVRILGKGVAGKIFRDLSYSKTAEIVRHFFRGPILSYLSDEIRDIRKQGPGSSEFIPNAIKRESA